MRLDSFLVEHLGVESRTKAQNYIKSGYVKVDNKTVKKSAFDVNQNDRVALDVPKDYVSRAAWKLAYFLEEIDLEVKDKQALDIGSSTGGFTQVLLENGAKKVVALDVGKAQLHPLLKADSRVISIEETDVREFESKPFELVVSDVSFISLLKILDDIDRLATQDIILLFKPQFEVGRNIKRDKKGVVQDKQAIQNAMERFEVACEEKKWRLLHKAPAKISGKEGNVEYCYYFVK